MSTLRPGTGRVGGRRYRRRLRGAAVMLGLWSASMYYAWLAWDRTHMVVDGVRYSVPAAMYSTWQVLGCGVSIVAAALLGYLWVRPSRSATQPGFMTVGTALLAFASVFGFTVAWTRDAGSDPTADGLFLFASLYLLVGGGIALWGVLEGLDTALATRRQTAS